MKIFSTTSQAFMFVGLIFFGACKPAKVNQAITNNLAQDPVAVNMCDQTIKYYSEKVKVKKTGEEIAAQSEFIINPIAKTISINSYVPSESERKSFTTIIESTDCSLNSNLTSGHSIYRGYIKQLDGSTTSAYIDIEAKDGGITMSNADPNKQGEFSIIVSRWEVVKQ